MHARKQRCPARGTGRFGNIRVTETNPLLNELINVRRLDPAMSHDPKRIITLIISEQENNIGSVGPAARQA